MNDKTEELEKIENNWNKVLNLISKIQNTTKRDAIMRLYETNADRIIAAPAGTHARYSGAFPGGLVYLNLKITKTLSEILKISEISTQYSLDTIISCGLLSMIGKIGAEDEDLYVEQDSQWHRQNGMPYKFNPNIKNTIPIASRSMYWINKFSVPMTEDEIAAILSLNDTGSHTQASEFYHSSILTIALQSAIRIVLSENKNKETVLD